MLKLNLRLFAILLLASIFASPARAEQETTDPFALYINSIPKVVSVISSTNTGSGEEAITTREIVFTSRNNINKVYGILSYPARTGKFPALLVLHGGSGNASGLRNRVEKFAVKGYVVFACDMPGYCNIENTPFSSGPWKSHPAPDEWPRFNIANSLDSSSLVDAEVAGLEAFNLLRSQPNADPERTGITGYSWGGYSTTMLAGLLGKKVKAAYSYWGCGFYDKGSFWMARIENLPGKTRELWLKYFDAGRRAEHIKANYFIEAASNDTYFWPPAVSATLKEIRGAKNLVWGPNVNHDVVATSQIMQEAYFDYYLKGIGSRFILPRITKAILTPNGDKKVSIKLVVPDGITAESVALYCSDPSVNWQSRLWLPITAVQDGKNQYTAIIPEEFVNKKVSFFAYVIDSRKLPTSSAMFF